MCEPTTILMIGTAVAGLYAQQQQADYQNDVNKNQTRNILTARAENANQIQLAQNQQADSASQKINENNIAMKEATGTYLAQGDLGGHSVDSMLASIATKGSKYNSSVEANLASQNMALQSQMTNVNNRTTSDINSLRTPASPDYLGTALKIGGAAYGSYVGGSKGTEGWDLSRTNRGSGD